MGRDPAGQNEIMRCTESCLRLISCSIQTQHYRLTRPTNMRSELSGVSGKEKASEVPNAGTRPPITISDPHNYQTTLYNYFTGDDKLHSSQVKLFLKTEG